MMTMKQVFVHACWILLSVAPAYAVEAKCDKVTYSANPQYPPYHWAAKSGRLEGASIDLLGKLLPKGVKAKPVVYPWKRVLLLAEHGEIDLVLSLRKTPERMNFLMFTDIPSFPNPIVVFVRADKTFSYGQWSDLKGKRGAISLGDKFGGGFDAYWPKTLEIQENGSMQENFQRLKAGQIEYFVTSQNVGSAYLSSEQGQSGPTTTYLTPPISDEGVYIGFSKKSPCTSLLAEFNRKLSAMEKQHGLEAILEKYLYMPR